MARRTHICNIPARPTYTEELWLSRDSRADYVKKTGMMHQFDVPLIFFAAIVKICLRFRHCNFSLCLWYLWSLHVSKSLVVVDPQHRFWYRAKLARTCLPAGMWARALAMLWAAGSRCDWFAHSGWPLGSMHGASTVLGWPFFVSGQGLMS